MWLIPEAHDDTNKQPAYREGSAVQDEDVLRHELHVLVIIEHYVSSVYNKSFELGCVDVQVDYLSWKSWFVSLNLY